MSASVPVNPSDPRPDWPPERSGEWVDLGAGCWLTKPLYFTYGGERHKGAWWAHTKPDGHNDALGRIEFGGTHHQLISEEPYTVGGSLLCVGCGRHGFVRGGKWVEA